MAVWINNTIDIPEHIKDTIKTMLDSVIKVDADVKIDKRRKKRSLNSNHFYWRLVTLLANSINESKVCVHNMMLRHYGTDEVIDDRNIYVLIPDTEKAERKVLEAMSYHLKPTSNIKEGSDGVMYRYYKIIKGSKDYTTAEMSALISGLIQECRNVGISDSEIMSSQEKEQLKGLYGYEF